MTTSEEPPLQQLSRLPREPFAYHWADYVELLCLANLDGEFSPDDLIERWKGQDDVMVPFSDDPDDGPPNQPQLEPWASKAAVDDQRYTKARDVFGHLAYRIATFGADYPFDLDSGHLMRLHRRPNLTTRNHLYVFLLLGSLLRYVPRKRRSDITTPFERLVAEVLQRWFPADAEVHIFGTAAGAGGRYRGTMWQKINLLGSDLGEMVLLPETAFNAADSGDLGLDVVAWFPLGDNLLGLPVFFAQVTCEFRWKDKQHESGRNWQSYLKESAPRGNLLFIPYCFRDASGEWFDPKWPTSAVVVDRQRLLWLLRGEDEPLASVPYDLVREALAYADAD